MKLSEPFFLAAHCLIEPLVNRWSAWSYLIAPLPASLYTANYLIPMMDSYLANPELHFKAAADLELYGGAFIGLEPERAPEIERLLEQTKRLQSKNIHLAVKVHEFHKHLLNEAKGQSLERYYKDIPEELRGCVELVYDYYNRPAVRFLEGALYKSDYYNEALQSFQLSTLTHDAARPSFFNTPRFPQADRLDCSIPFRSPLVDELCKCDLEPRPLGEIMELLNLAQADLGVLLPLLSRETAPRFQKYEGADVKVTYFGHACVLIEWKGVTILTDPFVPVKPSEQGMPRLSYRDLPEKIDYMLVTHNHQDHFLLESLFRLRNRVQTLVVPRSFGLLYGDTSLRLMARTLGFRQVIDVDEFESIDIPEGHIVAIPFLGEHADFLQGKTGYVVRCGTRQMLFGADSDFLDPQMYRNVFQMLGPIDTVFLGTESVGGPLSFTCGPLFPERPEPVTEQSRRYHGCSAARALELLETIGATRIYNYAMALEPWIHHLIGGNLSEQSPQLLESEELLAKARMRGFEAAERLFGPRTIYLERRTTKTVGERIGGRSRGSAVKLTRTQLDVQSPPGIEQHSFTLAVELVEQLDLTARELDCERTLLILTAFVALLFQCTEAEEMVLETADPAGPAVQPVSLSADLSGDPTLRHLLKRIERLLYQVTDGGQPDSLPAADSSAIHARFFCLPPDQFDQGLALLAHSRKSEESTLQLLLTERDTDVSLSLVYHSDAVNSELAGRLGQHLSVLLQQIITGADRRLSTLVAAPAAATPAQVAEQFQF